jgi:hypothetical protein
MIKLSRFQKLIVLGTVSLISLTGYLLISCRVHTVGFPLDDAWIHQVYARNLAESGQWIFSGAQSSGGSTSPLWSALISFMYIVGVSPAWGTHLWGWLMLWGAGAAGMLLYERLSEADQPDGGDLLAGVLLVLEWHLVWAAGSGMETLLFSLLGLVVILLYLQPGLPSWTAAGALSGLAVWVRPGALSLLLIPGYLLILNSETPGQRLRRLVLGLSGFSCLFLPYLWFNKMTAGTVWPNTFFAKQAEYAILRQIPLISRIGELSLQPVTGVGLILVPGLILAAVRWVRQRHWAKLAGLVWSAGYLMMYSLRLPVTYQHGRYLMPVIPILVVTGWLGLSFWLSQQEDQVWQFVISRAWLGILGIILAVFWGLGAQAYGRDVGVIETEMVRTAVWIQENIPEEAVLGAHDIGALGYFTEHEIVDLAGLVSPDVIPFIRDEKQLARYLDAQGADYLVAFPSWYPELAAQSDPIYQSGGRFAPRLGNAHMTVYKWNP